MPNSCVVSECKNIPNLKEGISLYTIPFYDDLNPEAKKRRKKWVDFVKSKRAKWNPSKGSVVCSNHFIPEDFTRMYATVQGQVEKPNIRALQKDDLGVCVWPTKYRPGAAEDQQSERTRRKVKYIFTLFVYKERDLLYKVSLTFNRKG